MTGMGDYELSRTIWGILLLALSDDKKIIIEYNKETKKFTFILEFPSGHRDSVTAENNEKQIVDAVRSLIGLREVY